MGMIYTSIKDQYDLPRYFSQAFGVMKKIQRGRLDCVLPDGRIFRLEGPQVGPIGVLEIHNPDVFARLIREGDLGFCDAYVEGWWSSPDLQALLDLLHVAFDDILDGFPGMALVRAYEKFRFWLRRNSKAQAPKNISYHYDLGNAFYGLWLDETMTYSSALFETGQESLERAQTAKYAKMVDGLQVAPGDHILEIGCGWGGFAEYAAKERGLRVTGLTISQEQLKFARERIEKAGLTDLVTLKLQDYRDETGRYDGIASIEMFEAVGEAYWPTYFNKLRECLNPGRKATLQVITIQERRWELYRKSVDFIQKYIFPGGMLPSPGALRHEAKKAQLDLVGSYEFGQSYSQTLRRWHANFSEQWDRVAALGFDARFRRMWEFYLTSCASSFWSENCDVTQVTLQRPLT